MLSCILSDEKKISIGVVLHTFNHNSEEVNIGRAESSKPAPATVWSCRRGRHEKRERESFWGICIASQGYAGNPVLGKEDLSASSLKALNVNTQQSVCPVEFVAWCTFTEVLGRAQLQSACKTNATYGNLEGPILVKWTWDRTWISSLLQSH